MRTALAILAASALASVVTTIWLALLSVATSSAQSSDAWLSFVSWSALAFAATALVASTIGLAWHAFCQRRNWTSIHAYWTAGAIAGAIPGALWLLPSGATSVAGFVVPLGASLGGLTGLFAWLIRRPDRDGST